VNRPLHRCALRFPRTASSAFKDATYASAVEIYTRRDLWSRIVRAFKEWLR
jgi:hypothetical protein